MTALKNTAIAIFWTLSPWVFIGAGYEYSHTASGGIAGLWGWICSIIALKIVLDFVANKKEKTL